MLTSCCCRRWTGHHTALTRIDEAELIGNAFPEYTSFFAYNYRAWCVPIPVHNPIGRVNSGMLMLSRWQPIDAVRLQYPSAFPFLCDYSI